MQLKQTRLFYYLLVNSFFEKRYIKEFTTAITNIKRADKPTRMKF
jgi:hypothetical protein